MSEIRRNEYDAILAGSDGKPIAKLVGIGDQITAVCGTLRVLKHEVYLADWIITGTQEMFAANSINEFFFVGDVIVIVLQ